MAVKNLTSKNFDEFISKGASIVDFSAEWCSPCKFLKPIFEEASSEVKDVKFGSVDVEKEPELAQRFQVMSVPTLIFFKRKEQIDRFIGILSRENLIKKAGEISR